MKKLLSFLMLTMASAAQAQTDITAQYLQNPSFEQDDISTLPRDDARGAYTAKSVAQWTLSGNYGVSDIMTASATATDNNFGAPGKPADGSQMYYLRHAWADATPSLLQQVKLPAGRYRLTVDNKCITTAGQSATLVAGTESTALPFQTAMPSAWATTNVDFELNAEATIPVGIKARFVNAAGGSILVDNFRLYDMKDYVEPADPTERDVQSFTEGVITNDFVAEPAMMNDLLQMLANFSLYMVNDFQECQAPNSKNELCGAFRGENTMGNNEQGVRPNADLSMICAFLVKYGKPAGVTLPAGVTWDKIDDMAMKSLVFAYSTHKANKLKVCAGGNYWGSTSTSDVAWESSLWAMSVAYSAFFQWDKLSGAQKGYIYQMLKAECNYELNRSIPTGYAGDTKAEENGWEADILAVTLGLFPNDALAPKWFDRLREFAINSYSHPSDAANQTVIDPDYDQKTVADLYRGQNLYDDYSLQNHNLFHTSYQNVVMQELGEAALAMKMFQQTLYGEEKWKTNALMHHNQEVQDSILNWLALADGELAMPNGNDWSLFLYDQITSYTTQACFQRDPHALLLENLAYKYIKARQQTTQDGSWLLRADVGARRMGVEAHRVMMTYLMHAVNSTADLKPTAWNDFRNQFSEAKILPCQNIVRAYTPKRFSCFSWSNGLKSYTGYFTSDKADANKIIVPYRANNTGNITGWYEVSGKGTNAEPVVSGIYQLQGNGYVMNGELNTNDKALNNRFAIYSTPGNAIIYLDHVTANAACTITAQKGGMLAISTDELMKTSRTLYYNKGGETAHRQLDGSQFTILSSDWVNIDNEIGIINLGGGKKVAFGDRGANNSIFTSKLYPMYDNAPRSVKAREVVDSRSLVYYQESADRTAQTYATQAAAQVKGLPQGWNGANVQDDVCNYFIVANFAGQEQCTLSGYRWGEYAPVFNNLTEITDNASTVSFALAQNNSYAQALTIGIKGSGVTAQQIDDRSFYLKADAKQTLTVRMADGKGSYITQEINVKKGETLCIRLTENNEVRAESAPGFPALAEGENLSSLIVNPSFAGNSSLGWSGTVPACNYDCAEFFNKTYDMKQTVRGLLPGRYAVGVQGFYRDGTTADAARNYQAENYKSNAILYANDSTVALTSIMTAAGQNYQIGVTSSCGYVPNTMEQAASYFRRGLYVNTLVTTVGEDGILQLGIRKKSTITSDWTIFDNFTLTYLGPIQQEEPDGIHALVPQSAATDIYTLQGQRVSQITTSGLYVVDGNKVLVR